jgi:hypothetical protein
MAWKETLDMVGLACMTVGGIGIAMSILANAPKNPTDKQQRSALRWARYAPHLTKILAIGVVFRIGVIFL